MDRSLARAGNAATWIKAELALAVTGREFANGLSTGVTLHQYARDLKVPHSTLKSYVFVAKAFPADQVDRLKAPFGVAETFVRQQDRLELAAARRGL